MVGEPHIVAAVHERVRLISDTGIADFAAA